MQYLAKWGQKGFVVNPYKLVPFENLKTSFELKLDENDETNGTTQLNVQGRESTPVTFSTTYFASAGVDVRGQIEEWKNLIGRIDTLYINGKPFGERLLLKKVDVTETELSNNGEFVWAKLTFTFIEYYGDASVLYALAGVTQKGRKISEAEQQKIALQADYDKAYLMLKKGG